MNTSLQTVSSHGLPLAGVPTAYHSVIKVFNRWLGSRRVTQETIREYFDESAKVYKVRTMAHKKAAIKKAALAACKTLAEKAQVEAFFAEIKTGQAESAVHEHEILTRQELSKLTASADAKTAAIVSALYETAARVSELLSVRLSDCETRGNKVFCLIRRGKRNKQRTAFLSKETFDALRSLYAGKTYLLERKGKPLTRQGIGQRVSEAGAAIGRGDVSPHTLRHCAATHLLTSGQDLAAVAAYCGHADSAVTAKFYLHSKPSADAVLKILGAL